MRDSNSLKDKITEALRSILPIGLLVVLLCFSIAPVKTDVMLSFLIGSVLLIFGLGLFMFGSDHSVTLLGESIGSKITQSRNFPLILTLSFILGIVITVAEPDLSVLAANVPHISSFVLIFTVAVGVGLFLLLGMMRILLGIELRLILLISYALIFILAFFSDPDYLSIAFDSGGVTTGPMTAPFIISLGIGVASIRSDKNAEADSFGLVGLCSVGPILAVLLLGFFYPGEAGSIAAAAASNYLDTVEISKDYILAIPSYMLEVLLSLSPILVMMLLFQLFMLKMKRKAFLKMLLSLLFTYAGLVLFLTGVNVGFSSLGVLLGEVLLNSWTRVLILPIAALLGWFVINAEPAVHTLTRQVEEVSAGAIPEKTLKLALSIAIALAMVLSVIRAVTGISILWFVVPGYGIALLLMFAVPKMYTAIAFDSGGVASGPLSAAFMLPFAMGICTASGGDLLTDAFGIVSMVAMMPLITIQILGAVSLLREHKAAEVHAVLPDEELEIIDLF